jgi:Ca-activated chloride channel family protein
MKTARKSVSSKARRKNIPAEAKSKSEKSKSENYSMKAIRENTRTVVRARALALIAVVCALLFLIAASSRSSRAQSGRKTVPSVQDAARSGKSTPTPTPVTNPPTGPIAEPSTAPKSAPPRRPRGTPPPPLKTSTEDKQADGDEVDEGDVVRITSNLVPLPVSVVDARGRAVADLKLEDFELKVDGELKPVAELTHAETPVSIALLFDNSSSLNATRDFERQAGVRFLRSVVRPVDRAAIYSISTAPELAQTLTNNVDALVRTIEGFGKPVGATALFDTVAAAADYLKPQKTRRVIIIVSDGTDTTSDLDFDTALARVLADDCQVYAIQNGNSDSPNLHDLAGERRLQEFAAQTGGAVYVPRTRDELGRAFTQIATDLAQQYVLSYYTPSNEVHDGRFRTLTLNVKTRPNLKVRTRKGYYAPKS